MSRIRTARLCLIPCSLDVGLSIIQGHGVVRTMPGISLPDGWPDKDLSDILPWYVNQLKSDPGLYGWGIWLMIDASSKEVVGDIGFKGKPDRGSVEIGYSILPACRRQGYGIEAARALVDWALGHREVDTIRAECEKDNIASIHLLEKLGMRRLAEDGDLLKWEIRKAASATIS
jgi:ribosomal-protein-alanine N-acetyltransferase